MGGHRDESEIGRFRTDRFRTLGLAALIALGVASRATLGAEAVESVSAGVGSAPEAPQLVSALVVFFPPIVMLIAAGAIVVLADRARGEPRQLQRRVASIGLASAATAAIAVAGRSGLGDEILAVPPVARADGWADAVSLLVFFATTLAMVPRGEPSTLESARRSARGSAGVLGASAVLAVALASTDLIVVFVAIEAATLALLALGVERTDRRLESFGAGTLGSILAFVAVALLLIASGGESSFAAIATRGRGSGALENGALLLIVALVVQLAASSSLSPIPGRLRDSETTPIYFFRRAAWPVAIGTLIFRISNELSNAAPEAELAPAIVAILSVAAGAFVLLGSAARDSEAAATLSSAGLLLGAAAATLVSGETRAGLLAMTSLALAGTLHLGALSMAGLRDSRQALPPRSAAVGVARIGIGLSRAGVPLTIGFASRWLTVVAIHHGRSWPLIALVVVAWAVETLRAAGILARTSRSLARAGEESGESAEDGLLMVVLALAAVAAGIYPDPWIELATRAARDISLR
jgi:multicomponent Na+:H+ antiporter subunit D